MDGNIVSITFTNESSKSEYQKIVSYLEKSNFNIDDGESSNFFVIVFSNCEDAYQFFEITPALINRYILLIHTGKKPVAEHEYWKLLDMGAKDIFEFQGDITLNYLTEKLHRWQYIENILQSELVSANLIGCSQAWIGALRCLVESACYSQSPILLLGESGTGKEMLAKLAHSIDLIRNENDMVILDCSTISPELSGSEFFGHEKGAFTGAHASREGAFSMADKGSLFLDEVGELPLHLQPQLLRVIQEKSYKPIGGNNWHQSDFRLVCATNRKLEKEITLGQFRQDLYYRIACNIIYVPNLAKRRDDILCLAEYFLKKHYATGDCPEFSEPVKQYLTSRDYPGNIRHLKQIIDRIAARHCSNASISVGDIAIEERPNIDSEGNQILFAELPLQQYVSVSLMNGKGLKDIGKYAEDLAIETAMQITHGNTREAANMLHISDRTIQLRKPKNRHFVSH